MADYLVASILGVGLCGVALGAAGFQSWQSSTARKKRQIPAQWHLQARPLLSSTELEVWHWLQRVFFEYDVLVKIPLIRFIAPRSEAEGQRSYDLIKSLYCSFNICTVDGTVIGCVDVPGANGLKAGSPELKQTLFGECALAYAVVRAGKLPTLEAMRFAFLGEADSSGDAPAGLPVSEAPVPDSSLNIQSADSSALTATIQTSADTSVQVDMLAVTKARNRLHAELDRNRKIRFTNFDPLSSDQGMAPIGAGQHVPVQWEDSFIMIEGDQKPGAQKK